MYKSNKSLTGKYLSGKRQIKIPKTRRKGQGSLLSLKGAHGNNLKSIDIDIPLGCFIAITGVSGSGKSTLINETLFPILAKELNHSRIHPLGYKLIEGLHFLDKVVEIDQKPIGRTPRSNPATVSYTHLTLPTKRIV